MSSRIKKSYQAVILAGGFGTRLSRFYNDIPKSLVPINNIPIIQHIINNAIKFGVTKFIILVSYKKEQIISFIKSTYSASNAKFVFVSDPTGSVGTVPALINALPYLEDSFLLLYSDVYSYIDYEKMFDFHYRHKSDFTLLVHPNNHPFDSDLVQMNSGSLKVNWINGYPHREPLPNICNRAIYVIERSVVHSLSSANLKFKDIAKEAINFLISKSYNILGYKSFEFSMDMGTPNRVIELEKNLNNNIHIARSYDAKRKGIFIDRDGVINANLKNGINSIADFKLLNKVSDAILLANKNGFFVCLITNQPGIAKGFLTENQLNNIHNYMSFLLGNSGAYIDDIYFCPHHPESGFKGEISSLKIDCNCRKPKSGLLYKAMHDNFICKNNSWMIGDSLSDIEAGKNASLKTILIADSKNNSYVSTDHVCADLLNAIKYIVRVSKS